MPSASSVKQSAPVALDSRKSYGKLRPILEVPNLVQVQLSSFRWFQEEGLRELFEDISPIQDFTGSRLDLRFLSYEFRKPQWSEAECRLRNLTYSAPLYVRAQLLVKETGEVKEQEIFFGDFPIMTPKGTFITSGAERVVISQLLRSPGVYLTIEDDPTTGRPLCMAKLIPDRGAWLEFETSNRDVISVKVDGKRKIPVTTLFRALGYGKDEQLLSLFEGDSARKYVQSTMERDALIKDTQAALLDIYKRLRPGDPASLENARLLINNLFFNARRYDLGKVGRYKMNKRLKLWHDMVTPLLPDLESIDLPQDASELASSLKNASQRNDPEVTDLLKRILLVVEAAALKDMEKLKVSATGKDLASTVSRSGGKIDPDIDHAWQKLSNAVKDSSKTDWKLGNLVVQMRSALGRLSSRVLTSEDLIDIVRCIIKVNNGEDTADDIDHLGNRRVRTVGELIQNQFRIGLLRLERVVKERMSIIAPDAVAPSVLVNTRPVVAAMREFFGGSQLSQFMDQTNPLAELTHKRRLSTMGPGGLSRERAGFDVRDVHYSHYGRICPIETPEGPNIGLIGSLATYSRINEYGFIETPYRRVLREVHNTREELLDRTLAETVRRSDRSAPIAEAGTVVDDKLVGKLAALPRRTIKIVPFVSPQVLYLSADKEEEYIIAQANARLNERNEFVDEEVETRRGDDYSKKSSPSSIDFMDVSPKQVFSVAASLIPFFEHNDANRALMGSNMQRQAVPLLKPEAPLVATGMEREVARYSGQLVFAEEDGEIESVTGSEVKLKGGKESYSLTKFTRTNQGTCINQRPVVNRGDKVVAGQVLADSSATDRGELALGQNVVSAFMSWEGYNFEDAIILSEALVRDDKFTSIHLEKYEIEARDTKLGAEEITRDIPNVGEESLRDLDEHGIVRVGAEVKPGDILVGKITPKGETELTAEERLLRAIFGDKAHEVKDNSLRVPHGEWGKVIDVKVFSQKNHDELPAGVNQLVQVWVAQRRKISVGDKMAGRHGNKGVVARILPVADMPVLPDGRPVDVVLNPIGVPSRMNLGQVLETHLGWAAENLGFKVLSPIFDGADDKAIQDALARYWIVTRGTPTDSRGDELSKARLDDVKKWVADQGYDAQKVFDDEHLGVATNVCLRLWLKDVGVDASNMDDDEVESQVEKLRRETRLSPPTFGKILLRDGRTGEPFDQPVTVGNIYIMKLIHLAEDKIHARSTGPYSLITQQPLGGKAQFGGQRFGEMEVWALEAYGAAHILQELLTVKSDDVMGRAKTYEAIVKGDDIVQPGVPESFKVLVKELQSLCLAVEVLNEEEERVPLIEEHEEYPRLGLEHEFTTGAE